MSAFAIKTNIHGNVPFGHRGCYNALRCSSVPGAKHVHDVGNRVIRRLPKEERRQKILDGVERLILEKGSADFTMHELAAYVGISPTTFYNLFGSKGAVLYCLLNRGLDAIIDRRHDSDSITDPIERAIAGMTDAADLFISKPKLFRPLYKFQLGERDLADRPYYLDKGLNYWRHCLDGLVEAGYVGDVAAGHVFERDDLALALLTHSVGVLDLWVQEDIDDSEFRARMAHDTALIIAAVVPESERSRIREIIEEVRPFMRKFSFVKRSKAARKAR